MLHDDYLHRINLLKLNIPKKNFNLLNFTIIYAVLGNIAFIEICRLLGKIWSLKKPCLLNFFDKFHVWVESKSKNFKECFKEHFLKLEFGIFPGRMGGAKNKPFEQFFVSFCFNIFQGKGKGGADYDPIFLR